MRRPLAQIPPRPARFPAGSAWSPQTGWIRPNPSRRWRNPADQGPPLEDIGKLIRRAEAAAALEWQVDHGELPWSWPPNTTILWSPQLSPDPTVEAMGWPARWFADHLFELPPLGAVPWQWRMLFS